jgi:hypothetical protein
MEEGECYADAHLAALVAEGNLSEAEIQKRSYIRPEETKMQLDKRYPALKESQNKWRMGKRIIRFDPVAGIIYLHEGDKIIDEVLIRGSEDIEKFISKYKDR